MDDSTDDENEKDTRENTKLHEKNRNSEQILAAAEDEPMQEQGDDNKEDTAEKRDTTSTIHTNADFYVHVGDEIFFYQNFFFERTAVFH